MSELPKEIETTYLEVASFDERIAAVEIRIRAVELETTFRLTTLQDANGKLVLSNEMQRQAAVAKDLAECEEYAELIKERSDLKQDKKALEARLERLRMEWRQEMQANDHRNALLQMQAADAILKVRYFQSPRSEEIELPF